MRFRSISRRPEGLRLPTLLIVALAAALVAGGLQASGHAQQPQQPAQPVFRSSQRLIVTTVAVKDREGKPIEGLTAKDFIVTEDNLPQDIAFVEFQRLADQTPLQPMSSVTLGDATPAPAPPAQEVQGVVNQAIAVPPSGDARFRDRRLVILYFDLSATPPPDQIRSYDAALKYIDTQMTPADLVAIMT